MNTEDKRLWTTQDGKQIPFSELTDSHLANIIKMIKRFIDSYPGEQIYMGDSDIAEEAVESENRINEERLHEAMEVYRELTREQSSRKTISPVIEPWEVARFRQEDDNAWK